MKERKKVYTTKNVFSRKSIHTIIDANINFYTAPFVHPKRNMREHDFIYLLGGEWSLGQNGTTYELKEDSLLILFAGNTHYGVTPCKAETKTMYFHVSCEAGDFFGKPESGHSFIDTLTDASHNKSIKKLFSEVVNAKLSGEQRKADLYFELLICELTSQKMCFKGNNVPKKIQNAIHSYPERFFSNTELADMMNVSVKTAESKFKSTFGKTIHQYMLDFKISEAMSYFDRFEEMSVKEVAYNLGFCDEYHFSKQFLKHTGMSPSKYKKSKNG